MRRVLLLALLLGAGCEGTDTGVYWELERMVEQPRFEAYGRNDFFADARSMRHPPPGTVRRGAVVDEPLLTRGFTGDVPERARPGRRDLPPTALAEATEVRYAERIPLPLDAELLAHGRRDFERFCAACHGLLGDGDSPVARAMSLRRPPSLHQARLRAAPPGRLYRVVREGYGLMPGYEKVLTVPERWGVVAYVQALQLSQHAELHALPPPLRAEARAALPDAREDVP